MNKIERVNAVLQRKEPDRAPVLLWYHFGQQYSAEQAADLHYELYKKTDQDVLKVMYDNQFCFDEYISKPSDWRRLQLHGLKTSFFGKQLDILRRILDKTCGECPVWTTMFGPFKLASFAATDPVLMAHCKAAPEDVKAGIAALAEMECELAEAYLAEGASAIFYSAQFAEIGRFERAQWEELVKPFDLQVLAVGEKAKGKNSILHLCGEPEYGFKVHIDWYEGYPGSMVNWAVHPNQFPLEKGREFFKRPVLGGLDNRGLMAHGTVEEVMKKVQSLIRENGKAGLMIGPDCSLPSPDSLPLMKAAVDAAKSYRE